MNTRVALRRPRYSIETYIIVLVACTLARPSSGGRQVIEQEIRAHATSRAACTSASRSRFQKTVAGVLRFDGRNVVRLDI